MSVLTNSPELKEYESKYLCGYGDRVFYHKFVDFEGNNYEECNERLKNNALKEFEENIKRIKREEGISDKSSGGDSGDDKSDKGMMKVVNILLFSLFLIIFI